MGYIGENRSAKFERIALEQQKLHTLKVSHFHAHGNLRVVVG
jgi:hypothetical protein